MFADSEDPWDLATSPYEAAKFDATISALAGRRYPRAFEVGCATGVLTVKLAALCGDLLAVDISSNALMRAHRRCAQLPQVRLRQMSFPAQTSDPDEVFDLIVLSEVAYYWDESDLSLAGERIASALADGGDLLLVHWLGETDYPQTGDGAVNLLREALGDTVEPVVATRTREYRLDLWRRR